MSYAGTSRHVGRGSKTARRERPTHGARAVPRRSARPTALCAATRAAPAQNGTGRHAAARSHVVTESYRTALPRSPSQPVRHVSRQSNGRPDFARMTPAERLAYHRQRLGLGR